MHLQISRIIKHLLIKNNNERMCFNLVLIVHALASIRAVQTYYHQKRSVLKC
jgi:hypothetical protein